MSHTLKSARSGLKGGFVVRKLRSIVSGIAQILRGYTEPVANPRKIGVYGGKFDPPHLGHLICAEMVREKFKLDKVLFVTSAVPPHKKTGVTDAEIRHELVEAAVFRNCFFEACDIELQREGPSYTLDTLLALRAKYGDEVELHLMLSSEYLEPTHPWHLSKWHGADGIFAIARILIFAREGHTIDQAKEWGKLIPQAQFEFLDFCPSPPVSSTLIRDRVGRGESVWYMVTTEVGRIIRRRKLYGYHEPRRCTTCQKYGNLIASWVRALKRRPV